MNERTDEVRLPPDIDRALRHAAIDAGCEPGELAAELLEILLKPQLVMAVGFNPANTESKGYIRGVDHWIPVSRRAWEAITPHIRAYLTLSDGLNSTGNVKW